MKIQIPAGRYVAAVSGGVDSVVLLDLLRMYPGVKIVVAHYDHGIREDSAEDRKFVRDLARRYGLPFVYDQGSLGTDASEAKARTARYKFLTKTRDVSAADAIVTAHHQDDVLETAVINLVRGTGRKGLSSLTSGEGIIRPLLSVPKSEIIDYAVRHGLTWREDSTNASTKYLRNHIRHSVLPNWGVADKQKLVGLTGSMQRVNGEIDDIIRSELKPKLDRHWFIMLPHSVAREVMAAWLRDQGLRDFDRAAVERLTVGAKVASPGKHIDAIKGRRLRVGKDNLALVQVER